MYKKTLAALAAAILATAGLVGFTTAPAMAAPTPYVPYQIVAAGDASACLDVSGVSYSNGALLQMYTCLGAGQANQIFYLYPVAGTSYYRIRPSHSWKCLDVQGVSIADYAPVQQYTCLGDTQYNQIWDVYYYDAAGGWGIVPTHSWKILGSGGTYNGASVYQNSWWAYWRLVPV